MSSNVINGEIQKLTADDADLPPVPAWALDHMWWQIRCYLAASRPPISKPHPEPPVIPGREDTP